MRLEKGTKNRGVIYFFYDGDGVVDRYVTYMLKAIKECAKDVYVVTNGALTEEGRASLLNITEHVWERENEGLDVGAYKYALYKIGWEKLESYDEIVLMNHTIMGPVRPLMEMFDRMGEKDLDFWGANNFYQVGFDPYGIIDLGYIPEHLQSHFIVARRSLVESEDYKAYWENLPKITNYKESVAYHETFFTRHFAGLGYRWEGYSHRDWVEALSEYPLLKLPVKLIRETGCPFFKRRNFMHNYDDFPQSTYGEPTAELLKFLEEETDYDVDMIWENILRTANQATIKDCLNLNYVVSGVQSEDMRERTQKKGVAFVYHFYYEDCLEDLLHYAASFPEWVDFYFTTGKEEKKALLEKAFSGFKNKVEVRIVENRGRDVSALIIGAKDVIDRYEYICFAHDKKVVQLRPLSQGTSWAFKCFENVMGNRHVVENILKLFEENPRLGMLSPAPPNHGGYYSLMGDEWTANFENVKALAEKLEIHVPMSKDEEPIAPIGTIFWFRSGAMKKLSDAGLTYEDFPAEPAGNDGTLSHAIERIYPFSAQAAGYYPAWIFSDEGASLELTNYTYMLRTLNTILYPGGVGGPYFTNTRANLEAFLKGGGDGKKATAFLTPKLYLDYGEDFTEQNTINEKNRGMEGFLKVVFHWPEEKGTPLRVRFDPCERGKIALDKLSFSWILSSGKRKAISLETCLCNGNAEDGVFLFRNPDPWFVLDCRDSGRNPVGLEIRAKMSLLEEE